MNKQMCVGGLDVNLVIPAVKQDLVDFEAKIHFYYMSLPIKKIVIIGNKEVCDYVTSTDLSYHNVEVINENDLISYQSVQKIITDRDTSVAAKKRTGWYLQQFLKMYYSYICEDDYYLVWDLDTIPTKKVILFKDSLPVFHLKTEYNKPYFDTLSALGLGFSKEHSNSFISEHMLIKTDLMRELIENIERSNAHGDIWYAKIINAIQLSELPRSGFSEFETMGNYVYHNYRQFYKFVRWRSLREGKAFFEFNTLEANIDYLSRYYDAISFEKSGNLSGKQYLFWQNKIVQTILPPQTISYFVKLLSWEEKLNRYWRKR